MEKAKQYTERFLRQKKKNDNYDLRSKELLEFTKGVIFAHDSNSSMELVSMIFNYGYAKGYRACKAEQKKGVCKNGR